MQHSELLHWAVLDSVKTNSSLCLKAAGGCLLVAATAPDFQHDAMTVMMMMMMIDVSDDDTGISDYTLSP